MCLVFYKAIQKCVCSIIIQNIKKKMYGSTEAFLADVKWILHNCIIYNGGWLYNKSFHFCLIIFGEFLYC